jgi:hypothetical protein
MKTVSYKEFRFYHKKEKENFTGIVKHEDSTIEYLKNGKYHREDGPAVIWFDGLQDWFYEGKPHNLNGPAVIWPGGREEYYVYGTLTTKEAVDFLRDLYKLKNLL